MDEPTFKKHIRKQILVDNLISEFKLVDAFNVMDEITDIDGFT